MDRLSSYAVRESESEPKDDREKIEAEATAQLLEKLRISKASKESKEPKEPDVKHDDSPSKAPNGEQVNSSEPAPQNPDDAEHQKPKETNAATNGGEEGGAPKNNRGIPEDVKLYEIFYGQVTHLVNAQRLHIHDTMALLVSLTNLAL